MERTSAMKSGFRIDAWEKRRIGFHRDAPSSPITIGPIDAVCDRTALAALPEGMRARYAAHLAAPTGGASQLLACCDYDVIPIRRGSSPAG